jgi:hypothetical protein
MSMHMSRVIELLITPSPQRNSGDRNYVGRYDGRVGDRLIVERSRTPFCDVARDYYSHDCSSHDSSKHVALCAAVGVAAKLTVNESNGSPRFRRYDPAKLGRST